MKKKDPWIAQFIEYITDKKITSEMKVLEGLLRSYGEKGLTKRISAVKYKALIKKKKIKFNPMLEY